MSNSPTCPRYPYAPDWTPFEIHAIPPHRSQSPSTSLQIHHLNSSVRGRPRGYHYPQPSSLDCLLEPIIREYQESASKPIPRTHTRHSMAVPSAYRVVLSPSGICRSPKIQFRFSTLH